MPKISDVFKKGKKDTFKKLIHEMKFVLKISNHYKWSVIGYIILNVIGVIISAGLTLQIGRMVDSVFNGDMKGIVYLALFYIAMGVINIVLGMLNQRYAAYIYHNVRKDLVMYVYDVVLKSKWEKMTKFHSGDLIARLNEDVETIAGCISGWIPCLISQMFQLIVAATVIIVYDVSMLGLIILVGPIILLGSRLFVKQLYNANEKQRAFFSELMSFYKESFHNIQSIKAFGLNKLFYDKRMDLENKNYELGMEVNKYTVASWGVTFIFTQVAAAICLLWTGYRVMSGVISIGSLAILYIFASKITSSAKELLRLIPNALATVTATTRVRELLALPEENIENEEHYNEMLKKSKTFGAGVELKNIDFTYENGTNVFNNVSMSANPGEMVALVGPSGEGKTTMLRLILSLIKQQNGDATISVGNDEDCKMDMCAATRRFISYVPQGNTMMRGTIAENMRMTCPNATDEEIIEALKGSCAYPFVEKLPDGINHKIGENGGGFSEGQNQRLAIARALMNPSPILLLDEATSALDVATERKVLQNLMKHDNVRTCILTTHRPSVLNICDKVYRIAEHKVRQIDEQEVEHLINDF